jgi:hypothetical protein
MAVHSSCCGGYVGRRVHAVQPSLPPNPKVHGGVAVIYLGSGNITIKGENTGVTYYASDHRRQFKVHTEDAKSILRQRDFILSPSKSIRSIAIDKRATK